MPQQGDERTSRQPWQLPLSMKLCAWLRLLLWQNFWTFHWSSGIQFDSNVHTEKHPRMKKWFLDSRSFLFCWTLIGMRWDSLGRTVVTCKLVPSDYRIDSFMIHSRACNVKFVVAFWGLNAVQDQKESCTSLQTNALKRRKTTRQSGRAKLCVFGEGTVLRSFSAASSAAFGRQSRHTPLPVPCPQSR